MRYMDDTNHSAAGEKMQRSLNEGARTLMGMQVAFPHSTNRHEDEPCFR